MAIMEQSVLTNVNLAMTLAANASALQVPNVQLVEQTTALTIS
jgi:hypothetical protein